MDDDGDPAVIAGWISEATAAHNAAQQVIALGAAAGTPVAPRTRADVGDAVATLGLAAQALTLADPASKAKLYDQLGKGLPTSQNRAGCSWTRR
jgi:hypothetical protein